MLSCGNGSLGGHAVRARSKSSLALAALALLGFVAFAQKDTASSMDVLREQLGVDKRHVVDANLVLTESQATQFWPIYDEYQAELGVLHERFARVVREYAAAYDAGTLTNAYAVELLDEAIAVDEAEVELRKTYARRLKRVIPGIEAARYLQIENKIHAVVKFDLAENIPLAE
jgi:hypothetical protein